MSLRFIFGACGSGKTEYVYRSLLKAAAEHPNRRFFLLVPEQDTLQTQQALVSHPMNPGHGIWNIDVLSFHRLAYRVFEEKGCGAFRIIDDMGKMMILRRVAEQKKDQLILYGRQLNRAGFLSELKSQISELYQYRVMPDMVRIASERASSAYMQAKLKDLAVLYEAFRNYLEEQGYLMQEELLDRLYDLLPESELIRDAEVVLDGFTGFTPVQLELIQEMMRMSARVSCTVTADHLSEVCQKQEPDYLFYLSSQTVGRLTEMAEQLGIETEQAVDLNRYDALTGKLRGPEQVLPRFEKAVQLDALARHIYRFDGVSSTQKGGIHILEAPDQTAEIEAIAEQIARSVREDGLRYREIGMIVTDVSAYRDVIYQVFGNAGIPYFIDDGKSLLDSPYAELVRAALEVPDEGFSYEAVMRYLRAMPGRTVEKSDQVDLFDNYLRARGIRGASRYQEHWEEMEEQRSELISPLLVFREQMQGQEGKSVAARSEALRTLMKEADFAGAVDRLAEKLQQRGELNRAEELRQSIAMTDEVLERLVSLLGSTEVSLREYRDLLDAGLAEAEIRAIPATLDQVIIGDLTRSRFASIRRFFLAGAGSEQIPKAETGSKIISDRERVLFRSLEIELAPSTQENALIQRFYLYRALLTPSEELWLSYPMKGHGGKGLKPSGLIGDLLRLFPSMRVEKIRNRRRHVYTPQEAIGELASFCSGLSSSPELLQNETFLAYLCELLQGNFAADTEKLLQAAFTRYAAGKLEAEAAEAVYGSLLKGSITRLELFNQCAFAHFLKYGLQLQERKRFEVQAFDIGNLYHAALEACFRAAMEMDRQLYELDEEEMQLLVRHCVEQVADAYEHAVMRDTARSRYLLHKVEAVTRTTLWALAEQLRRGDFRVTALEQDFDLIQEGIRLKGRIDRIDSCEEENRIYVKVIDYKSGKTEFDLNQIMQGIQLQLSVYMETARKQLAIRHPGKEIVPAAMLYYHIEDPILDYEAGRTEDEASRERLRALRADGLVNTDLEAVRHLDREIEKESDVIPVSIRNGNVDESKRSVASGNRFAALNAYVLKRIKADAERILSGEIAAEPVRLNTQRSACTYCPYHAVCGFDPKIEGFRYRKSGKRKPEEIWAELMEEEKEEGTDHA